MEVGNGSAEKEHSSKKVIVNVYNKQLPNTSSTNCSVRIRKVTAREGKLNPFNNISKV